MGDEIAEEKPPLDPAVLASVLGDDSPNEGAAASIADARQDRSGHHGVSLGVGIALAIAAFAMWWWLF